MVLWRRTTYRGFSLRLREGVRGDRIPLGWRRRTRELIFYSVTEIHLLLLEDEEARAGGPPARAAALRAGDAAVPAASNGRFPVPEEKSR